MSVVDVTVTIGPEGAPLVLTADCGQQAGITWTALTLPDWSLRYNYAPPSNYVPGNVLLSVVPDSGAVAMTIAVQASSLTDLKAKQAQVKAALMAWPGVFKMTGEDGNGVTDLAGPWDTFPTLPGWGDVLMPLLDYYYVETTISLPVNP